nr:unnamed protein product [Haemonchus contortus]
MTDCGEYVLQMTSLNMLFYFVGAIVLLNAFTVEAGDNERPEDDVGEPLYTDPSEEEQCDKSNFEKLAECTAKKLGKAFASRWLMEQN